MTRRRGLTTLCPDFIGMYVFLCQSQSSTETHFLAGVEFHRVCLDHPGRDELAGDGARRRVEHALRSRSFVQLPI